MSLILFDELMEKQQRAFRSFITSAATMVFMIGGLGLGYSFLKERGWLTIYVVIFGLEVLSAIYSFAKWRNYDGQIRENIGFF